MSIGIDNQIKYNMSVGIDNQIKYNNLGFHQWIIYKATARN